MPLIASAREAEILREAFGELPHGIIVNEQPPARWPYDQAWPPEVTIAAACWRCVARRHDNPLVRYLAERPIGELVWD